MPISTMPVTSTVFKSKLNHFITKLSHHHQEQESRQTDYEHQPVQHRKASDANSVESITSIADKFRQVIPFFRRRSSSNLSTNTLAQQHTAEEATAGQPSSSSSLLAVPSSSLSITPITTTTTTTTSPFDYVQSIEKLGSLYTLAIDELNYAIDSQGSSYYPGDLVTAREALNDCANAFMQLLLHTTDPVTRESLQSYMAPRLMRLQKKLDALPEVDEDNEYY